MQKQVAIIGAGIAGLSCATVLKNAGFGVSVLEKSRGVSGRLSTRIVDKTSLTEGWQCDHGAQYFTARDSLFNTEVQRWVSANVAQLWQPRLQVFDGNSFVPKQNDTERFVGYPRNSSPAKWLANSLNILPETTITSLQKQGKKWQISTKEHGQHTQQFDYVLLAIPAPQAAVLLQNAAPKLENLAASVKMQACFALMLNFKQSLNSQFDGLFINDGLISWVACDSAKPGRLQPNNILEASINETWVLHASSQWSEAHVDDDKETVAQQMQTEFARLLSLAQSTVAARSATLQSHALHRWLYADCENYLTCGYQLDTQCNIGLCGDWLNGGKVQGAWLSGLMLAKQLIAAT